MQKKVAKLSKEYMALGNPDFTRSGSVVLDALLGGGIPQGVFILWSAENGCGKSTGSLHISKIYCMQGKRVIYLDYEGGVNKSQLDGMGLSKYLYNPESNPEGLFYLYKVQTYRDAETILDEIMNDVDLVVIDSVTAMLTEKVKGVSAEDQQIGVDARVMSTFLKKYKAEAVRNGVTWILINQMRTKIATGWGQVTHDEEAGGQALKFYPDIRLQMKRAYKGTLEREEETASGKQKVPFGALCTIWAAKNRYERPNIPLTMAIIFGKGIDNNFSYEEFLENTGVIKKSGAWFTVKMDGVDEKFQGMSRVISWINDNREKVRDYINSVGGYRLLMNEENPVDIGGSEEDYDESMIDSADEFDAVVNGTDESNDNVKDSEDE